MFIATEYRGELADPNGREEEQHKKERTYVLSLLKWLV